MSARPRTGVRVIAGSAKGRRLETPPGDTTRPITDRVKESLFGHLMPHLSGAHVLDLYAGSGALSLEAISRGAASAVLVERDPAALAAIEANVDALGFGGVTEVVRSDVAAFLRRGAPDVPFDLVFDDPPYSFDTRAVEEVLQLLAAGWVGPGSRVVVRRRRDDPRPALPERFEFARVRNYGDTLVLVAAIA